jgi:phospholipase C
MWDDSVEGLIRAACLRDSLSFRMPLLIVSPYDKERYVTHVQYETASVLRFIEDNFGPPRLSKSDARANDPATDAFDYDQKPHTFKKTPGGKSAAYLDAARTLVNARRAGDHPRLYR